MVIGFSHVNKDEHTLYVSHPAQKWASYGNQVPPANQLSPFSLNTCLCFLCSPSSLWSLLCPSSQLTLSPPAVHARAESCPLGQSSQQPLNPLPATHLEQAEAASTNTSRANPQSSPLPYLASSFFFEEGHGMPHPTSTSPPKEYTKEQRRC